MSFQFAQKKSLNKFQNSGKRIQLKSDLQNSSLKNEVTGNIRYSNQTCACGGSCPKCKSKTNIQPKLIISSPDDIYEKEANDVTNRVMLMKTPESSTIKRENTEERSKLKNIPKAISPYLFSTIKEVLNSPGKPLNEETRAFMEYRFGFNFSNIRIHDDSKSSESAKKINALAYTSKNNIVFNEGKYSPNTNNGKRLLAHELTHVVQQSISTSEQGNVQVSPVSQVHVQRFESPEHVQLGDTAPGPSTGFILLECHTRDLPQHASPVNTWPQVWQTYFATLDANQKRALQRGLTYGEIVALTGDMYVDFQALNRAPLREVIDLIPRIRSATTTTQQFQEATGGRYLALAKQNIGHFSNVPIGQRNRDIWRRNHIEAIMAARSGNANVAWGLNAAGDHFLTDAFSGGHVRTPRALLHAKGIRGDVESKVLHDLDNEFGVRVTNNRGDRWVTYGDAHLNDAVNARGRALALEAVQLSKQDIANALARRTSYPIPTAITVFSTERLIPRPVSMTANRWTNLDMVRELGHLVVSEAPGVASGLTADDDRVRNWVNRMDVTALGRQSYTDIARMLNVLLSGVVTDDDMHAIERLLGSVRNSSIMRRLRAAFRPRAIELNDFGLRTRFRIALERNP